MCFLVAGVAVAVLVEGMMVAVASVICCDEAIQVVRKVDVHLVDG